MTTNHRPFKSVLIANRGEIAVRIVKETKALKLRAIAVYSDADVYAAHVSEADTAIRIGPPPPAQSYLNAATILAAAKETGAEAIHPGYGFLSENADFAQAVIDAGLVWIGPSPEAIRAMGDKGNAKQIAIGANVPVIPGYDGADQSDARLLAEARKIGWPVLIKAAHGGGGRGQRRVTQEPDFAEALAAAKREALSAFASDRMILERALDGVRHIEVQVFGDAHGNIIHLGERDCSVQRRNQKVIEEAPASGISEDLRIRMGEAAVRLAHAVKYANAGTVEYLLDPDGKFYFLEMNTRIQVEHPVTEEVTGTNLVRMQLNAAMGKPLDLKQADVHITGHAMEARLCTEDPFDGYKPQQGRGYFTDEGNVRIDSEAAGFPEAIINASGDYDSMIAKIIASGPTRAATIAALRKAFDGIGVHGLRTNRNLLMDILEDADFQKAPVDIAWLSRRPPLQDSFINEHPAKVAALMLADRNGTAWRSTGPARTIVKLRERDLERTFVVEGNAIGSLKVIGSYTRDEWTWSTLDDRGTKSKSSIYVQGTTVHVSADDADRDAIFEDITYAPAEPKGAAGANVVRAPMAGRIVKVTAEPGAKVEKNQILVILEAMKMEHELRAGVMGTVESVSVKPGDQVAIRQTLVTLSPA